MNSGGRGRVFPDRGVVVTVIVTVELVFPLSATELCDSLQFPALGAPVQVKLTLELNPLVGVRVRVKDADCPAVTEAVEGDIPMAKSVPTPARAMDCGLPPALLARVTAPLLLPARVGLKVTLIVQFAPAARDDPHVLLAAKSPLATMLVMLSAAFPPLLMVTV